MKFLDNETEEPIKCPYCGEMEKLRVVEFVFGDQLICDNCGQTVR